MPDHVQEEDEDALKGVEDGEDPGEGDGSSVDYEETKDPRQPQQWQQDDGGFHYVPTYSQRERETTSTCSYHCSLAMFLPLILISLLLCSFKAGWLDRNVE